MKLSTLALVSVFAAASTASAAVETYAIDPAHSSVAFEIRHVISKVPGRFTDFSGTIMVDRDNLEKSSVTATIQAASVDTSNQRRNNDLKAPAFFNVAQYSTITFASTSWKKTGDSTFDVTGNLTIHGVTKEVVLKVVLAGFAPGMMGGQVSGWEAKTTLNRRDYGVNGPAMLGAAVGDEVAITINIEADLKK